MPVYEYRCEKCGHVFDVFQRVGEGNEKLNCPECGTPHPVKLFSAFAAGGASRSTQTGSGSSCGTGGFS